MDSTQVSTGATLLDTLLPFFHEPNSCKALSSLMPRDGAAEDRIGANAI